MYSDIVYQGYISSLANGGQVNDDGWLISCDYVTSVTDGSPVPSQTSTNLCSSIVRYSN